MATKSAKLDKAVVLYFPPDTLNVDEPKNEGARCGRCFAGDTLVYMGGDFLPISDLKLENVMPNGARINGISHRVVDEGVAISIWGWPDVIKSTRDHPFLTAQGWKNAENLLPGDRLIPPSLIETPSTWPAAVWWLIGLYLAEGWLALSGRHHAVSFSVGPDEKYLLDTIRRISLRYFPGERDIERSYPKRCKNTWTLKFDSKKLYNLLRPFGTSCYNKKLTPEAMCLPKGSALCLWRGYWLGDGAIEHGYKTSSSVSRNLSLDFKMLLGRFGQLCGVRRYEHPSWHIEGRTGASRPTWKLTNYTHSGPKKWKVSSKINSVRKVELIGEKMDVWDISLDKIHTFCVGGATVHNCMMGISNLKACTIVHIDGSKNTSVDLETGVCGLYVSGPNKPQSKEHTPMPTVSRTEAGYIEGAGVPTHCGNCEYYEQKGASHSTCKKVEGVVEYFGCCNAWDFDKENALSNVNFQDIGM